MLKKVYFAYTVIITAMLVWLVLTLSLNSTKIPIFSTTIPYRFFEANIFSIITMTICAIKLQRKNENYVTRVLPFILLIGTFSTLISINLLDIKGFSIAHTPIETVVNFISDFLASGYTYILPLAVLMLLEPNNKITDVLKKIGYVAVGLTAAVNIFVMIKTEMVNTLPNLYANEKIGLSSLDSTLSWTSMFILAALAVEVGVIIIGFLTNYCLEAETIQSEDLDYEELADQANAIAKTRQEINLGIRKEPVAAPVNQTPTGGQMNLSNQMNLNSNVGVVDKGNQNLKVQHIDKSLVKVGPVVNTTVEETPSVDPAKVQTQAPAPAPAPQQVQQVQPVQAVQQAAPVAPQTPMPQNVQQPVPNNQTNQVQ